MFDLVLLDLLLEHHFQGDHKFGVLLARTVHIAEFSATQRFANFKVVQRPGVFIASARRQTGDFVAVRFCFQHCGSCRCVVAWW